MRKPKSAKKRRKQKYFQFKRNGKLFTITGLTAQSALRKLLRKRISVHERNINPLNIAATKLKITYSKAVSSFSLNFGKVSMLRVFLNFLMRAIGFKPNVDIQKADKKAKRKLKIKAEIERDNFELTRPYSSEFKHIF